MATNWKPSLDTLKTQVVTTFTVVRTKLNALIVRVNAHVAAEGNVHKLKAKDINLENVPNYAAATKPEAEGATNNTTLMTPARTREWAETNVYGPIAEAFQAAADKL